MSRHLNCQQIEVEPGRWYYLIEDPDADPEDTAYEIADEENPDQSCSDWRRTAGVYGPFPTEEALAQNMNNDIDHGRPATVMVQRYEADFEPDTVLSAALTRARAHARGCK
ncbi:hypothetical protein [Nocardia suismassiliense]|uniref:hypothetical protein n=1 Tax=Nocardia suismassiliense TaxID=2077092 RepID=UPI000D1EEE94|nr:hypothetical protein [Nocardia suismassiliense]